MALVTINWTPSQRQLRQFAGMCCLFCLAASSWIYNQHGWSAYVWSLGIIGMGVGVCGGLLPDSLRYPYVGIMVVTYPVGWVVSQAILILIYYGLFTVVASIFRLIGRDALQRRFEPTAATYWQRKRMPEDMRRYLRQY